MISIIVLGLGLAIGLFGVDKEDASFWDVTERILWTACVSLALFLGACGSEGGKSGSKDNSPELKEQVEVRENTTYYFDSKSDLMSCDEESINFLVYVKEEKSFLTCDGLEWSEVEIKETVETTKVVTQSTETITQIDNPEVFDDILTDLTWTRVGQKNNHPYELVGEEYVSICERLGSRLPTKQEITTAISHGLWVHLEASALFFESTGSYDLNFGVAQSSGVVLGYGYLSSDGNTIQNVNGTHGIFCIE